MRDVLRTGWFAALLGGFAGLLAVVGIGVVVLVPLIDRVDAVLTGIEDTLPLVQELRPEVGRIDRNVETVTPQVGQLRGQLDGFDTAIDDLSDPVVRMEARLAELQDTIEPIEALPQLQQDFGAVSADLAGIRSDFAEVSDSMHQLLLVIEELDARFAAVVELLEKTAEHVENLDRKTGPAPPEGVAP